VIWAQQAIDALLAPGQDAADRASRLSIRTAPFLTYFVFLTLYFLERDRLRRQTLSAVRMVLGRRLARGPFFPTLVVV